MHVSHMKEWFLARGYPEIVVNNQIDKVVFGRDQSVKKNLESGIPFVKELGKMIRDLLLFYTGMVKFERFSLLPRLFSHLPRLYLTEVREK